MSNLDNADAEREFSNERRKIRERMATMADKRAQLLSNISVAPVISPLKQEVLAMHDAASSNPTGRGPRSTVSGRSGRSVGSSYFQQDERYA